MGDVRRCQGAVEVPRRRGRRSHSGATRHARALRGRGRGVAPLPAGDGSGVPPRRTAGGVDAPAAGGVVLQRPRLLEGGCGGHLAIHAVDRPALPADRRRRRRAARSGCLDGSRGGAPEGKLRGAEFVAAGDHRLQPWTRRDGARGGRPSARRIWWRSSSTTTVRRSSSRRGTSTPSSLPPSTSSSTSAITSVSCARSGRCVAESVVVPDVRHPERAGAGGRHGYRDVGRPQPGADARRGCRQAARAQGVSAARAPRARLPAFGVRYASVVAQYKQARQRRPRRDASREKGADVGGDRQALPHHAWRRFSGATTCAAARG